jgi:hypothetical protein
VTLERIERFVVPRQIVEHTERSLREAGRQGNERFVLWTGHPSGVRFDVRTSHVPRQTAYQLKTGLLVRVEGQALHELNVWLYDTGQVLGAQVHAHPTEAFHSDTDDTFPIVTTLGGLSLVVPDFCRAGLLPQSAAYRLTRRGWVADRRPVARLIEFA